MTFTKKKPEENYASNFYTVYVTGDVPGFLVLTTKCPPQRRVFMNKLFGMHFRSIYPHICKYIPARMYQYYDNPIKQAMLEETYEL